MLWRDTALQISTPSRFIPRFLLSPAHARRLLIGVCAALGLFAAPAHADPFQDVIALAEQGVPELALHIIDQQQTSIDPLASEWAAWEKARILIYQQRRDWVSVVRRTQALHDNLRRTGRTSVARGEDAGSDPLMFTRWVLTQGAAAQLESGQGAAARAWLLRLIWQAAGVESQLFAQWRRMVIHSYVVDGLVDDAYAALLRYQQDYAAASTDAQTRLLQAHVLLLAGRAAEAAAILADTQEPAAAALYLLARLRSGGGRPENILQEARQLLAQQPVTTSQGLAAVVQAEAAQMIGDHERHVEAVEYVLALYGDVTPSAFVGLFNITDDSVWDAYVAYAQVLSNQQQLLMGDFAPWFAMAQSLAEEHPIRARALFAFLAMRADDAQGGASVAGGRMPGATTAETRVRAHQQLVTLLGQLPQGAALMRALYIKLDRFH